MFNNTFKNQGIYIFRCS